MLFRSDLTVHWFINYTHAHTIDIRRESIYLKYSDQLIFEHTYSFESFRDVVDENYVDVDKDTQHSGQLKPGFELRFFHRRSHFRLPQQTPEINTKIKILFL